MPDSAPKKTFNTIAILGLIVVVLSSIIFLLPTLSNDQSEVYKFTLPLVNEISVKRNQLMFILVAELFFGAGIYLLIKGLRSDDENGPSVGAKKDKGKIEEEPKEEPSSLEKVIAGEEVKTEAADGSAEKKEDTPKTDGNSEKPKVEEPKTAETTTEPVRTTGPIHLSDGKTESVAPPKAPETAKPA